jgi:hypothetical protein
MPLVRDTRLGRTARYRVVPDGRELMQVADHIRKCVVFIWYNDSSGKQRLAGTAFLIVMEEGEFPRERFFYLITAKRVIVKIKQKSTDGVVGIRYNAKNGGSNVMETANVSWIFHEDPLVDVAVMPCSLPDDMDYKLFPREGTFVDKELIDEDIVQPGDDIYITGLFVNHVGKERNIPVIRVGNIAAMPEEPVSTNFGSMEAYLVEARSTGGLSGSPVFLHLTKDRVILDQKGRHQPRGFFSDFLLGLVHGHFDYPEEKPEGDAEDFFERERINKGMAVVVPATKIAEALDQKIFADQRQSAVQRRRAEDMPTMDSADASFNKESFDKALRLVSRRVAEPDEGTS